MVWANLDMIVRRLLLENKLPIHYYEEYLVYAASALRELAKDSLMMVRAVRLPVNEYYAADLPSDFKDDVMAAIPINGVLVPINKNNRINPMRLIDADTGAYVAQPFATSQDNEDFFGFTGSWLWYWNVNDYGEMTGRYFGSHGGTEGGYKIIKERNQIQFTGAVSGDGFVLLYVSNGQSADNATQVDWAAFSAIMAYSNWKQSPNAHIDNSPEGLSFYNQRRLMRADLNDMTVTDVKNIFRKSYTATIKN